jgi:hypothetical protein
MVGRPPSITAVDVLPDCRPDTAFILGVSPPLIYRTPRRPPFKDGRSAAPAAWQACLRSLSGGQRAGARSGGAGTSPALPIEESVMAQYAGRRRKLTDAQIHQVLAWHSKWLEFRARWGTQESLARRLQIKKHLIYGCIARYRQSGARSLFASRCRPKQGRPKILQTGQARAVIAWHLRHQRFLARHGSANALARSLGVSVRTVHACIGRQGTYREITHSYAPANATLRPSVATSEAENRIVSRQLRSWRRQSS